MKSIILALFLFVWVTAFPQNSEAAYDEFVRLYKENYLEWITSPEIQKLQRDNPDIRKLIETIPIQETKAYREVYEDLKKGGLPKYDFDKLFEGGVYEYSMDAIRELLSPESTDVLFALYWKVIKSAESKEIVDLIMPHIEKARRDVETMGVEIARSTRK